VQVHGGMGFIEETGAAQYYRDARILTIYEGTTAIQANDLVGRKTARDGGATARYFSAQMLDTGGELVKSQDAQLVAIGSRLLAAAAAYERVIDYVVDHSKTDVASMRARCRI
jgi:butyryl-CoA dehydrogenase